MPWRAVGEIGVCMCMPSWSRRGASASRTASTCRSHEPRRQGDGARSRGARPSLLVLRVAISRENCTRFRLPYYMELGGETP